MRNDPDATIIYIRWSEALGDWIVCESTDKGAILFKRDFNQPTKEQAEALTLRAI